MPEQLHLVCKIRASDLCVQDQRYEKANKRSVRCCLILRKAMHFKLFFNHGDPSVPPPCPQCPRGESSLYKDRTQMARMRSRMTRIDLVPTATRHASRVTRYVSHRHAVTFVTLTTLFPKKLRIFTTQKLIECLTTQP